MLRHREIEAELQRFLQLRPLPAKRVPWHVRKLLNCIHEHLFDPTLNVRSLKTRCNMRDNNVSCHFKHALGISIKSYIEGLRLEAARVLLNRGSYSAAEVAQSVGYTHLQTFYRAFARHYGRTPGDVRGDACDTPVAFTAWDDGEP
jgi:AraC-like DNA-binding protein